MITATVEDLYGSIEIILFENNYTNVANCVTEDNIVLIEGKLSVREDEDAKIIVRNIKNFSEAENIEAHNKEILTINITNINEETKSKLRGALKFFNGDKNNILVQVKDGEAIKKCGAIYLTQEILKQFEEIVGSENIKKEIYS
jgi:DNA polymerase-3 subunit alpha